MMRGRGGFALPAMLAVLAVTAAAATGLLGIAVRRALDAHDAARMVRTRAAAESAIREALAYWNADSMRALLPGGTVALPLAAGVLANGVTRQAVAERLDARRFLVHAEARHSAGIRGSANAAATALVTTVPIDTIWRDFYAAIASGGDLIVTPGATVSGIDAGVPAAWSPADCPSGLLPYVTALLGGPDRPGIALPGAGATATTTGATLAGLPPLWNGAPATDTADFHRLGPLPLSDVAAIADRTESGALGIGPASAGGSCDRAAPGNWGDPANPAGPCFQFVPLIWAGSDLEITAGTGQGILVVDGNVTFRAGSAFVGIVLATGRIDLDGARVTGAVRAGSGGRIGGVLESSACAVGRILERARALRRPYRLGDRLWIPPF